MSAPEIIVTSSEWSFIVFCSSVNRHAHNPDYAEEQRHGLEQGVIVTVEQIDRCHGIGSSRRVKRVVYVVLGHHHRFRGRYPAGIKEEKDRHNPQKRSDQHPSHRTVPSTFTMVKEALGKPSLIRKSSSASIRLFSG